MHDEGQAGSGSGFLAAGAVLAGIGVALGAMGAHALEGVLRPDRLATFETAVRYQLIHALALLVVGVLGRLQAGGPGLGLAGWLFTIGIGLFSGSLYALVATDLGFFGAITPLGGVAFILGWGVLARDALRTRRPPRTEA